MATYADMEELIRLGAYRAGSSPEVDEAIRLHEPLEDFPAAAPRTKMRSGWRRDTVSWRKSFRFLNCLNLKFWKRNANFVPP